MVGGGKALGGASGPFYLSAPQCDRLLGGADSQVADEAAVVRWAHWLPPVPGFDLQA